MAGMDLGKQMGPLPMGAWIVVVGAGLGIAYYTRNSGKNAPIPVTDTSGDPGVGTGAVSDWVQTGPPSDSGNDTGPVIATNDDWGRAAVNLLIAKGYDPTASDQAIRNYLSGSALSVTERALVNIALVALGSPPTPLPPGPSLPGIPTPKPPTPKPPKPPTPTPKPPPHKPKVRYYTVVHNDNLWNIAKRYYGNPLKWVSIYNANRFGHRRADGTMGMIKTPNLIYPGWKLIIP